MPRPKEDGLKWFPLVVGFFKDKRIRRLIFRFGADGPLFYIYILCCAYESGYCIRYDDDFTEDAAFDLGCSTEKIGLMLHYLLDKSLLDRTLFDTVKVLSSHGIQAQYQESKKGLKRDVEVDGDSWILNESETEEFIKVRHPQDNSRINTDKSGINTDKSGINARNEMKGNENKRNENIKRERAKQKSDGFDKFWDAFPRKSGYIDQAYREYLFAIEDGATLEEMLAALEWQRVEWEAQGGRYTPSAEKWLHNRGWTQGKPKSAQKPESDIRKDVKNLKKLYESIRRGE